MGVPIQILIVVVFFPGVVSSEEMGFCKILTLQIFAELAEDLFSSLELWKAIGMQLDGA